MTIETFIPCTLLQPYIKGFLVIESDEGTVNTTYPDSMIVMAFRFRGKIAIDESGVLPQSVISGIRKSPRTFSYSQKTSNLIVKFKEGAASVFFKEPLHEIHSLSLPLDNIIQRSAVCRIEEQLAKAPDNTRRIAITERFLISLMQESRADLLIQKAVQAMQTVKGDIRINNLMDAVPLSRDAFEKRFRKATGTTPKQLAAIIRINNLINSLDANSRLTDAALKAGYFDQAHFIKDFRAFTGMLPHDFIKMPRRW